MDMGRSYERNFRTSHQSSRWTWTLVLLSLILIVHSTHSSMNCIGHKSIGGTFPNDDINIEYGSGTPIDITCILDSDHQIVQDLLLRGKSGYDSETQPPAHRLKFFRVSTQVSKQHVTIINATAARMSIPNPPVGSDYYYCGLQLETGKPPMGVCLNNVNVGYKPSFVTKLLCSLQNWESLTCKWTVPENPIKTKYELSFRLLDRNLRPVNRNIYNCPRVNSAAKFTEYTCVWDLTRYHIYRQAYEVYNFTVVGTNVLGISTSWIVIHHLANDAEETIKNVWVNAIGSTHIELRWTFESSNRMGAVLGFRIFYCPVVYANSFTCRESTMDFTVSGDEATQDTEEGIASIPNLKPYTTYMVTITSLTKYGESPHSDPLFSTTLEGAPDIHDLSLIAKHPTNVSVTVQWWPPKLANGIVRYYHIYFYIDEVPQQLGVTLTDKQLSADQHDRNLMEISHHVTVLGNITTVRLGNLESDKIYNIFIAACTTVCSELSFPPVKVRTAVGVPGRVERPLVQYLNDISAVVSWPRPSKPAGPIDLYQLVVMSRCRGGASIGSSQIVDDSSPPETQRNPDDTFYWSESRVYRLAVPDCDAKLYGCQQTFSISVRAVNANPLDRENPYYGPWSVPEAVGNC